MIAALSSRRKKGAKVDELMALCDRLAAGDATRRLLLDAVLHGAVDGPHPRPLSHAGERGEGVVNVGMMIG